MADKLKHVQNSIKVLGLEKVQNNIVGSPERRGVSGGQKKRVNIGMELVAMPTFLFMDEPTSGLDGAATVSLARCMGLLRKSGARALARPRPAADVPPHRCAALAGLP
jgi:ABC-type multidrug transport system ATPase subunit